MVHKFYEHKNGTINSEFRILVICARAPVYNEH